MIRHIVFFTARDRADHDRIVEGLSLLTGIRHARMLEVASNIKTDPLGNEIDIVVYGEFEDLAALQAYKADPIYQQSIARVRPLREMRYSVDYDVETAVTRPL